MPSRTRTRIQVRFPDIDMAHHVHNAVYLTYFETARTEFLDGFIPTDHDWSRKGLVLGRNEVDYRRPVRLRDAVEVETWCDRLGDRSFDLRYALFVKNGRARTLHAEGRSVLVCFDLEAGRTIPMPGKWRAALKEGMEKEGT
ncbi:MAG: acyl-CoA thioesterase [Flavobacteriales bacterium]|nr:acyl-CoA thioesterase [Flavobacteriales bacterium]